MKNICKRGQARRVLEEAQAQPRGRQLPGLAGTDHQPQAQQSHSSSHQAELCDPLLLISGVREPEKPPQGCRQSTLRAGRPEKMAGDPRGDSLGGLQVSQLVLHPLALTPARGWQQESSPS